MPRPASRTYSPRVVRFRQAVYAARGHVTPGCQVLLLRLSDDMNAQCIVSVPYAQLADDLDCPVPRISEWVKQGRKTGFLSVVKPARRGRTGVYQGLSPTFNGLRPRVTQTDPEEPPMGYATAEPIEDQWVTPDVNPSSYARALPISAEWVTREHPPTELLGNSRSHVQNPFDEEPERGIEEEHGCEHHEPGFCPADCPNHPANSRRTA